MAHMEAITAKLRDDEKKKFLQVSESIGTTPSNAIRMFIAAFNKRGGFPFDPSNPYGFNRETLAAMSDAIADRNLEGPFNTVADMWSSVFEGDDDA